MRLFQRLFHKPIYKDKSENKRSICRILAPSVISIFLCAVCLCGVCWAWFTASVSTGLAVITSPSYSISYQADGGETTAISAESADYEMQSDTCVLTLNALGTDRATGYCGIKIGDNIYYTEQITAVGTFTFTVKAPVGTTITLTPGWGSCAVRTEENKIANGEEVTIGVPAATSENTLQANENNVNNVIVPRQDESGTGDVLTPPAEEIDTEQYEADMQDTTEAPADIQDTTEPTMESAAPDEPVEAEGTD